MNETTILLSGDPKAKADFLATVEPAIPRQPPFTLPFELTLDRYTREPWSSGKSNSNGDQHQQQLDKEWQSCYLVSTDGRNKLSGFLQYLQGRKKSALTKFESTDALSSGTPSGRAILVVPYDPPPIPAEDLPEGVDKSQVMFVKYLRDENILKKYDPKAKKLEEQKLLQQKMQQQKMMQQKQMQMEREEDASLGREKTGPRIPHIQDAYLASETWRPPLMASVKADAAALKATGYKPRQAFCGTTKLQGSEFSSPGLLKPKYLDTLTQSRVLQPKKLTRTLHAAIHMAMHHHKDCS